MTTDTDMTDRLTAAESITYTACSGCGELLHLANDGIDYHNGEPSCEPRRTKGERLALQWLTAAELGADDLADDLEAQIHAIDNRPPRLLDAALLYASWGWPVFPLRPRSKIPATKHGFKDATTDADQIRAWWKRNPQANIGLPTGIAFDVIDVDVPLGPPSYASMISHNEVPDVHGQVATSSGGLHLYIEPTGEGNLVGFTPGVDYRGVGGYVVAPPSTLGERGRAWSWITKPSPIITGAAVAAK